MTSHWYIMLYWALCYLFMLLSDIFTEIFFQRSEWIFRINLKSWAGGNNGPNGLWVHIAKLFSIKFLTIYTLTSNINLTPVSSVLSITTIFFKCMLFCCLEQDITNWCYLDYRWASTHSQVSAHVCLFFCKYFVHALFSDFRKFTFPCLPLLCIWVS